MDGFCKISRRSSHLDCQRSFTDEFTCTMTDNAYSQDPLCLGIYNQFRHSVGPIERQSTTRSAPRKLHNLDLNPFCPSLCLCYSGPSDFWLSENDGRNYHLFEGALFSEQHLHRDAGFLGRFVSQQGTA